MRRDAAGVCVPVFAEDEAEGPGAGLPAGAAPERVVEVLRPFLSDARAERIERVLAGRTPDLAVVLDRFHDPYNASAVLRSCEAHGVQTVHVVEGAEAFVVARGASKRADRWLTLRRWPGAAECVRALRAAGFKLVAAVPAGGQAPGDLDPGPRTALVLGNEHDGISPDLLAACDATLTLPMSGFVESLNVSVAAAVCLSHLRPRFGSGLPAAVASRVRARFYLRSVERGEEIAIQALRRRPPPDRV